MGGREPDMRPGESSPRLPGNYLFEQGGQDPDRDNRVQQRGQILVPVT